MREIVHLQAGQCGNQIGAKVSFYFNDFFMIFIFVSHITNIKAAGWFCDFFPISQNTQSQRLGFLISLKSAVFFVVFRV